MMQDPYDILGIPRGASQAEARRAYRALARVHHPDVSGDPASAELFCRITEAYEQVCAWCGRSGEQAVRVTVVRQRPAPPRPAYTGSARKEPGRSWWPWQRREQPQDVKDELEELIQLMIRLSR